MSKFMQLQKTSMHVRPTYESLLNDSVLNPKDRIALPNRRATQLRNMQYLAQYDDPQFLDLDEQAKKITINQIHNTEVHNAIQQSTDKTRAEETAMQDPPKPPDAPAPPPKKYPPVPKFSSESQKTEDTAMQTGSGKPPPPPGGSSVKAKVTSSTQTALQFDTSIDDDMDDRHDDMKKFLAEHEQLKKAQQQSIAQTIVNHLGPHSSGADQSYLSQLAERRRGWGPNRSPDPIFTSRARSRDRDRQQHRPRKPSSDVEMEANNDAPPGPPPGAPPVLVVASGGASKKLGVKTKPKQPQTRTRKAKYDEDAIVVETNNKPPPPDNPPAPIVVKIPKSRSPRRGRSANPRPRTVVPSGTPAPTATTAIKQDKALLAGAGPLPPKPKARAKSEVPEPQKPPAPKPIDTTQKRAASEDVPRPSKKTNAQQVSEKPKPSKASDKPKPSKAPEKPKPSKASPNPSKTPLSPQTQDPPTRARSASRSRTQTPMIPPSRISLSAVARELQKLVDMKIVKEGDAVKFITLTRELNTSPPPKRKREIKQQLVGIYSDIYNVAKST